MNKGNSFEKVFFWTCQTLPHIWYFLIVLLCIVYWPFGCSVKRKEYFQLIFKNNILVHRKNIVSLVSFPNKDWAILCGTQFILFTEARLYTHKICLHTHTYICMHTHIPTHWHLHVYMYEQITLVNNYKNVL